MANRIKGITVEIGGDTTKLQTALKGVNSEIRNTQMQLKDVEKLLKLDPGNTELLAQKHKLLTQAVADTSNKLETLKIAADQANEALANGDISKDQYDALQREIIETEQALDSLKEHANESETALQKIATAGSKLQTTGDNITNVGKKMSVASAAIGAVGVASASMAMDFEDAIAKVNTIADTSQVPLDELEDSIIELSNQTGVSATQIAQNVYDAISAGQSTGDAVNFVTNSTKLAKAGFADTGDALDILTTIMNSYGLEASKVSDVSDMLIQTQNLGKTTVGELSTAMGKVIPTANAYGVQLDQLCAGYALMTSNGVATAESTTYINSMLNELGKSGTEVSDILKENTGSSFTDLMAKGYSLSDCLAIIQKSASDQGLAFGDMWSSSEAAKSGLILLGDSADEFNSTLGKMNNSTGATDTAFDKLQTNSYTIQLAINELKNTAIELGTAIMAVLAPIIKSLSEKISALTAWFYGLSDGTKRVIVIIGMIVAAVGPVLIVIGKVLNAVGTIMTVVPKLAGVINVAKSAFAALNTTLLANPIFLIIAAITALVVAFIYLWNNCEGFKEFWINLWETIKTTAINVWNSIKDFFASIWEGIKSVATTIWNALASFFSSLWDSIKNIFKTVLDVIKTIISNAFNFYKDLITNVITAIFNVISSIWNAIKKTISSVVNTIKDTITSVFNSIWKGISDTVSSILTTIKSGFNAAVDFIKGLASSAFKWGSDIINGIVDGIKDTIGNVKDAVLGVADTITSFLHFSVPDEGPLTDYENWMPDFMAGLAKGIESSRQLIQKAVSQVSGDMVINPNVSASSIPQVTANNSYDSNQGLIAGITTAISNLNSPSGDIVIPVYLGNTLLDEIIVTAQQRVNLRSGGR